MRAPRRPPAGPTDPRLPPALEDAALPEHDLTDDMSAYRLDFTDLDLAGRVAEAVEVEQCRLRGVDLTGAQLPRAIVVDCAVERSNWSNVRCEHGSLNRVHLADCRLTGFTLTRGLLRDVTFAGCRLDLAGLRYTQFTDVRFTGCSLTRADFFGSDLARAEFVECDLSGASFEDARMAGARFDRCVLDGVGGLDRWRGVTIRPADLGSLAIALAAAVGITVEDA